SPLARKHGVALGADHAPSRADGKRSGRRDPERGGDIGNGDLYRSRLNQSQVPDADKHGRRLAANGITESVAAGQPDVRRFPENVGAGDGASAGVGLIEADEEPRADGRGAFSAPSAAPPAFSAAASFSAAAACSAARATGSTASAAGSTASAAGPAFTLVAATAATAAHTCSSS